MRLLCVSHQPFTAFHYRHKVIQRHVCTTSPILWIQKEMEYRKKIEKNTLCILVISVCVLVHIHNWKTKDLAKTIFSQKARTAHDSVFCIATPEFVLGLNFQQCLVLDPQVPQARFIFTCFICKVSKFWLIKADIDTRG